MGYLDKTSKFQLFGRSRRKQDQEEAEFAAEDAPAGRLPSARSDLLDEIGNLLLANDLDITPSNLAIAHAAASGSDVMLASQIADRQIQGQAITQQWLDSLQSASQPIEAEHEKLDTMMDKLEQSILSFANTANNASAQTGEFKTEFQQQVSKVEQNMKSADPQQFLRITEAMLGTLQRIEISMKQSQTETEDLRSNLNQARSEANQDHLTGLPNRRSFERQFSTLHSEAQKHGEGLYVAICDVDHFKRVNDTFGHETGDRLLRAIAGILNEYASKDCFVSRHGGEEFAILLRCDSVEKALGRLNLARQKLEGRKFVARETGQPVGTVTFSAGLADVMACPNPRDALALADKALYRAKSEGRNRVVPA